MFNLLILMVHTQSYVTVPVMLTKRRYSIEVAVFDMFLEQNIDMQHSSWCKKRV